MKLSELKDWINKLPAEFDEFTLVNGEIGWLDERYHYRLDKPIVSLNVDTESKEIYFLNQTEDDEFTIPDDPDVDNITKALHFENLTPELRKQIERETWEQGLPIYQIQEGWLVECYADGKINKLREVNRRNVVN